VLLLQTPQQSLPLPILEPPNGYTIEGKLTFDTNIKPLSVEVTLEVDDGQMIARTMSGPNGDFRFDRLRRGRYYITIEGEKFWNIREAVNVEQGAFDNVRVSFTLRARPGMSEAGPSDATVSVAALRLPPPSREAQKEYEKAVLEQQRNEYKKAIDHLQKALKLSPDYYEATLQLGVEQHRAGKPDEALRLFERAVALNPGSTPGRHALGKIYFEKQEFQKSAEVLTELTKMGSTDADVYTLIGVTFYKLNDFHRAEEHLSRALLLAPANTGSIRLQLFNVFMKSNRLPQALEQLEAYLKDSPNDSAIQQQAERLRQILKKF
jgi:tetratricopeptide (TPR) repeat protein